MFLNLEVGGLHEPLTGRHWDRVAAAQQIRRRSAALARRGIRRADRVLIHYGNNAEFCFDVLAPWLLGACAVPVDPRFTAYEVQQLASAARPAASIWDNPPDASIQAALSALGVSLLDNTELDSFEAVPVGRLWPRLDDDALVLFTSGSTGEPKGVVHTFRSLTARWNALRDNLGVSAFERSLCPLPTHFSHGLIGACLFPWLSGKDVYMLPAFRTDVLMQLARICDEHAITYLASVPAMWRVLLRTVAPPTRGTLRRISCGTAPLNAALWQDIRAWTGTRDVLNIYGLTETGWLGGSTDPDLVPEDGLVGAIWGGTVRVLTAGSTATDPIEAVACEAGEPGYLWIQTPSLMRGYLGRDDLTDQAVARGWFLTGDVGVLDERGRLYLRGREKDVINVGGVKVYPGDIDAVAERCDGVLDACSFAYDDALQGENAALALVLRNPSEDALSAVYAQVLIRLAKHQLPRRWYIVETIPRTERGKVRRASVAAMCAQKPATDLRVLERAAARMSKQRMSS